MPTFMASCGCIVDFAADGAEVLPAAFCERHSPAEADAARRRLEDDARRCLAGGEADGFVRLDFDERRVSWLLPTCVAVFAVAFVFALKRLGVLP